MSDPEQEEIREAFIQLGKAFESLGTQLFAAFQPLETIIRDAIRDPMGVVIEGSIEVIENEAQATPAPGERAVQLLDARREEI